MKIITTLLVATSLFISNLITAQKNVTITATVVNVTSNEGKVGFALYNKENFMGTPVLGDKVDVVDGKSIVVFKNVKPGVYAITCYHDKNSNDKMDFAANGMPLEDYGASNNIMSFGPPNFEDAKFSVSNKDVSLEIKF
ncbi:DUF2141 domain-containing protein [Polaribacter litorisediminis]|uniref:DUF2141 domain-containing protein n=1 Tax=Polaribacter litorisediminis TaxID=1908341 RepID=UPI001CBCD8F1|nr:DUF2141 domain-containing protein [Polaribacter litorisediminis]UAM99871.1 DUF2141 domain-containing protein [Polaribacter litorisediminis]